MSEGSSRHGSPQSSHLKFALISHSSQESLSLLQLVIELDSVSAIHIGSLLFEELSFVFLLIEDSHVLGVHESVLSLVKEHIIVCEMEELVLSQHL